MALDDVTYVMRDADGEPDGALILFHGRGADEHDLVPLFDYLDPDHRYVCVTPRAPLSLPPGGAHWYVVRRVGFPNPETFFPTFELMSRWLDDFATETSIPIERSVLGGFSQGAVMSYALGLGRPHKRPAGIIGLSGFIPQVEGWAPDLTGLEGYPVAIGHGVLDPVIEVTFGREARAQLEPAGADVFYRESHMGHTIDPTFLDELQPWLKARF